MPTAVLGSLLAAPVGVRLNFLAAMAAPSCPGWVPEHEK